MMLLITSEDVMQASGNTNCNPGIVKKWSAGSTSSRQTGYEAKDPQRPLREETRER